MSTFFHILFGYSYDLRRILVLVLLVLFSLWVTLLGLSRLFASLQFSHSAESQQGIVQRVVGDVEDGEKVVSVHYQKVTGEDALIELQGPYELGNEVKFYLDPHDNDQVFKPGRFRLWVLPFFFVGAGALVLGCSLAFLAVSFVRRQRITECLRSGLKKNVQIIEHAKKEDVSFETLLSENSFFHLGHLGKTGIVQPSGLVAKEGGTLGRGANFYSEILFVVPKDVVGKTADLYLSPRDAQEYFLDVRSLR